MPSVEEMYPAGTVLSTHYDLGYLEQHLEGEFRPVIFKGFCQIVERLLRIINPTNSHGQKDYQQLMVLND
jgi:pantoate--beta-alanine ligase